MTPEEKAAQGAANMERKRAVFHAKQVRHAHGLETRHFRSGDPVPEIPKPAHNPPGPSVKPKVSLVEAIASLGRRKK